MGVPVYAGSGASATSNTSSLVIPYPSGIQADDFLLVQIHTDDNERYSSDDGGFSVIIDHYTSAQGMTSILLWLRAAGTESGDLTVTLSASATLSFGKMSRITGVLATGTPYEELNTWDATTQYPQVFTNTTQGIDRLALAILSLDNDRTWSGWNKYAEFWQVNTTVSNDASLGLSGRNCAEEQTMTADGIDISATANYISHVLHLIGAEDPPSQFIPTLIIF